MAPKGKVKAAHTSPTDEKVVKKQDWPPLTPLVPSSSLYVDTLLDNQILLIHNFFTSTLCKNYIGYLSTLPLTTTPAIPKRGEATRVNDRFQVDDHLFAQRLWTETGLRELVADHPAALWGGHVLGLNANIRLYRYSKGQFFDQHYDESNKVSFGAERTPSKTTWTLLIYLSTCEGGETAFHPESSGRKGAKSPDPIVVGLETGLCLLHRH